MTITIKSNPDGVSGAIQVNGVDAVTVDKTGIIQGAPFSFRNKIINGDMRIDQRNAGASITPTDGQFSVDRWKASLNVASKFSLQRSTVAPAGFTNSLLATSLSAYSIGAGEVTGIMQAIEGFNTADFGWGAAGAQTVTLSFWVRSSLTGTFGGSLRNSASNRSYPFSYTISAANTWEQKSVTISGDTSGTWLTDNGTGVMLYIALGVGSTFSASAGSWQSGNFVSVPGATSVVGTNGATFYITGVQLEAGSVATPFEHRSVGQETELCERYFEICGRHHHGGVWGSAFGTVGGVRLGCAGTFRTKKRAAPTCSSNGTISYTLFGNAPQTGSSQTFFDVSVNGVSSEITITSDISGRTGCYLTDNIWASSEL